MRIGILGAGNMTRALGRQLVAAEHQLCISYSRDPAKLVATAAALGGGTRAAKPEEAARFGEVLLLATGWDGAAAALQAAGPLSGKVIWSIVNPLKPDYSGLAIGTTSSGSEELAKLAPGAAFIAGYPPFAESLALDSPPAAAARPSLFYCGDDAVAKHTVAQLLAALPVEPIDAGPLYAARFIEPAMLLLLHLAYGRKLGPLGLRLLR